MVFKYARAQAYATLGWGGERAVSYRVSILTRRDGRVQRPYIADQRHFDAEMWR